MATVYKGVGCSWGVGASATTFGTLKCQSADLTKQGNEVPIVNGDGTTQGWVGYDSSSIATFEYMNSAASGGAATISTPTWGAKITIGGFPPALSGSNWIVKNVQTRATNTNATLVSVQVQRYGKIT